MNNIKIKNTECKRSYMREYMRKYNFKKKKNRVILTEEEKKKVVKKRIKFLTHKLLDLEINS